MNKSLKIAGGVTVALGLAFAAMVAHGQPFGMGHAGMQGMGHHMGGGMGASMGGGMGASGYGPMGGPTAMLTKQDANSAADMNVVHDLVDNNTKIKRSVTRLPNGIRTVTESDDPAVAKSIQVHVASMSQRLEDGREFNLFSDTLPVLFENRDKIVSKVEMTEKGAVVTRTSADSKVVAALQGHAGEVTELVQDGMAAMHRGMMSRMAVAGGMRPGMGMGMGMGMGHRHGPQSAAGAPEDHKH